LLNRRIRDSECGGEDFVEDDEDAAEDACVGGGEEDEEEEGEDGSEGGSSRRSMELRIMIASLAHARTDIHIPL
jgi:hypothetical protein